MAALNEALADELARQGVKRVFGLVGEDVVCFAHELSQRGVEFCSSRHESGAIAMADGYARVSGELAVALISRGPGVSNALTAMLTAAKASNPILVITGDCDPSIRGTVYSKWLDQTALFRAAEIPFVTIGSPESAVADLAAAFEWARGGKLLVAQLPGAILEAEAGDAPAQAELPPLWPAPAPPDPKQISEIADLLQESWAFAHPVILGGRGAWRSGARADLLRLGERCGAIFATTLMAKSLFDGDPFNVGISGTYSSERAIDLLGMSELVLAFGTSLDPLTTVRGRMYPRARVFRFDRDPSQSSRGSMPAEIFVEGDARLAAAALADELERRGHSAVGYRTDHVREQIAEAAKPPTIHDAGRPGALDPRLVMIRLNELLPAERNVILDNGHHEAFSTAHLNVPDPSAFQSPLEFHCVGASTGMAIGAAYARPDRLTVYCVGDLGMLMTMGDFESIARLGLPILVVVINDSALGAEVQYLQVLGLPDDIARESTPSFAAVAQGMGYEAYTIERLEDLDVLVGKLDKLEGPLLLDVPVTTDVRANWLEEVMLSHTAEPAAA